MNFIKYHWFGLFASIFILFWVLVFALVLASPRQDNQKRGFVACTDTLVAQLLDCKKEGKLCMLKSIVKNSACDVGVIAKGFGNWLKGAQSTPWANYIFIPELGVEETAPDEVLQEYYDNNPQLNQEMENLKKLNKELENDQ